LALAFATFFAFTGGGAFFDARGGELGGGALVRAGGRIDDLVLAADAFAEALPFAAVFDLLLRPVRSSFSAMLLDPSLQNAA
jgi:hypothetical protein